MDPWRRLAQQEPAFVPPMLASTRPLAGGKWVFERKFDGFRTIAVSDGKRVRLYSRSGHDVTERFANLVSGFPDRQFVVDGEAIALHGGKEDFAAVQNGRATNYAAFDVLNLDGHDVSGWPWHKRRGLLDILALRAPCLRSPAVEGDPARMRERACDAGWEGLIAKQPDSTYTSGRTMAWRKVKCVRAQEFVIGGHTPPQGSRTGFGALLVGYWDASDLRYAGKVGTGFDDATLRRLLERMAPLERPTTPFHDAVQGPATWVEPRLVAQVGFTEWTPEGRLRHPRFQGLRTDKHPEEVVRET